MFTVSQAHPEELKLPNLGESSTSLFSPEQEYKLGRAWLRMFRSQVPTMEDPMVHDYLESLLYTLVTHSELQDRRIELVVVVNPVLNAFAVPGGVIGIHTGLMLYAQSEDELATVLAHEIAHLSQRHFSRRVEQQKNQLPLTLAGMLAGAVLSESMVEMVPLIPVMCVAKGSGKEKSEKSMDASSIRIPPTINFTAADESAGVLF